MPNIEIHGLIGFRRAQVITAIDKKMQEIGLGDEAITTTFNSEPASCDGKGKTSPFLRVCISSKEYGSHIEELDKIISALRDLRGLDECNLDTETLILNSFIPKERTYPSAL